MKIGLILIGKSMFDFDAVRNVAFIISAGLGGAGFKMSGFLACGCGEKEIKRALEYMGRAELIIVTCPLPYRRQIVRAAACFLKKEELPNNTGRVEGVKTIPVEGSGRKAVIIEGENVAAVLPEKPGEIGRILPSLIHFINNRFKPEVRSIYIKAAGINRSVIERYFTHAAGEYMGFDAIEREGEAVIRLDVKASDYSKGLERVKSVIGGIEGLNRKIYSYGAGATIQEEVVRVLVEKGLTVAAAESCTGGLLTKMLTDVPGSSAAVMGCIVCYDNKVKNALLGVDRNIITKHGAVSFECAGAMAMGLRKAIPADIHISITGIAGPSGGTGGKPVGTVFVGMEKDGRITLLHCRFRGTREEIRKLSAMKALEILREILIFGSVDPGSQYGVIEIKTMDLSGITAKNAK